MFCWQKPILQFRSWNVFLIKRQIFITIFHHETINVDSEHRTKRDQITIWRYFIPVEFSGCNLCAVPKKDTEFTNTADCSQNMITHSLSLLEHGFKLT